MLLTPLPYADADRLVAVWATDSHRGASRDVQAYMNFVDFRAQASASFDRMAAYAIRNAVLSGAGGAELTGAIKMTPGLFDTWVYTSQWVGRFAPTSSRIARGRSF